MREVSRSEFDELKSKVEQIEQKVSTGGPIQPGEHSVTSEFGGAAVEEGQFVDPSMWTPNNWAWFQEHPETWRYVETPKWTDAINSYGPGGRNYEADKSKRPPEKPDNIPA